jgi:hypothetical protein
MEENKFNIENVEVFTYDNGKTFGYQLEFREFSIEKINKNIKINIENDSILINENNKLVYNLSAKTLKKVFILFKLGAYENIKEAKIKILSFLKDFEENILSKKHESVFLKYSQQNESYLDIKESNGVETDIYKKTNILIEENNLNIKEYFLKNIL